MHQASNPNASLTPVFTVKNHQARRTIVIRMSGYLDEQHMTTFAKAYKDATDTYGGQPHLVLADMRGMTVTAVSAAKILGDAIGYARARGVFCCAHLSDSTLQKLQANRMARESSPGDDVTVNVVSTEEAERVLSEARARLPALAASVA